MTRTNRDGTLDITKRAPGTGEGYEVDFSRVLRHPRTGLQTATIASSPAPVVTLEREVSTDPPEYEDVTAGVSIGSVEVVDGELPDAAVRFVLALDEDNTPPAGRDYQFVVRVVLSNGQGEVGFAPARIWPSATVPSE